MKTVLIKHRKGIMSLEITKILCKFTNNFNAKSANHLYIELQRKSTSFFFKLSPHLVLIWLAIKLLQKHLKIDRACKSLKRSHGNLISLSCSCLYA